jgi:hypothetical protein
MRQRITLFAKGNADLVDPVFGVRFADRQDWGGLNAAFRELGWPVTARIRHEPSIGFFSLTRDPPSLPADITQHADLFGTFAPALQYSQASLDGQSDAILLSVQADLGAPLARHVATGLPFVLHDARRWPDAAATWSRTEFERLPPTTPEAAMSDLIRLVARIQAVRDVPVLVANMTAVVPGDAIHSYLGIPDSLSRRIRRFNLALLDAAEAADFSVIDVDRIIALGGAAALTIDPMHYTREGCRQVALEIARILADRGVIDPPC